MERIWASDPAARLMVVGAHEDPDVMPMRWREGADRVLANGSWVRCEGWLTAVRTSVSQVDANHPGRREVFSTTTSSMTARASPLR